MLAEIQKQLFGTVCLTPRMLGAAPSGVLRRFASQWCGSEKALLNR
jgi:hypothetical protein